MSNRVAGATGFGLLFDFPDLRNNVIRNNMITGAGPVGMLVPNAY